MLLRRRFVTKALAIVVGILALTIVLTYYGINVGNFVITVSGDYIHSIALTIDENYEDLRSTLIADTVGDIHDADLSFIPNDVDSGIGGSYMANLESHRYYAYSFYLINNGDVTVNYTLDFKIVRAHKKLDSILRIMIIKDGERKIYAKGREDDGHYGDPEPIISGTANNIVGYTIPFLTDQSTSVIKELYYDFQTMEVHKYTIVMWLDGWDQQQVDDMRGASIQTELTFNIL